MSFNDNNLTNNNNPQAMSQNQEDIQLYPTDPPPPPSPCPGAPPYSYAYSYIHSPHPENFNPLPYPSSTTPSQPPPPWNIGAVYRYGQHHNELMESLRDGEVEKWRACNNDPFVPPRQPTTDWIPVRIGEGDTVSGYLNELGLCAPMAWPKDEPNPYKGVSELCRSKFAFEPTQGTEFEKAIKDVKRAHISLQLDKGAILRQFLPLDVTYEEISTMADSDAMNYCFTPAAMKVKPSKPDDDPLNPILTGMNTTNVAVDMQPAGPSGLDDWDVLSNEIHSLVLDVKKTNSSTIMLPSFLLPPSVEEDSNPLVSEPDVPEREPLKRPAVQLCDQVLPSTVSGRSYAKVLRSTPAPTVVSARPSTPSTNTSFNSESPTRSTSEPPIALPPAHEATSRRLENRKKRTDRNRNRRQSTPFLSGSETGSDSSRQEAHSGRQQQRPSTSGGAWKINVIKRNKNRNRHNRPQK